MAVSPGEPPGLWEGFVAAGGAAIGGFALWLANRLVGKAAVQTAINQGFKELTDSLREEREALRAQLDRERLEAAGERAQLRGEIINLTQALESLKKLLREHNIPIPEARRPEASPPPITLERTKDRP